MGAWGALIMGFFGAVFASLTLYWQWHVTGMRLGAPLVVFVAIAVAARHVIRSAGHGIQPSPREERAISWSTIGESVGLFLAGNITLNLHRPDLLLPSMACVVGLHFLPIAMAGNLRPFYVLGIALIAASCIGIAAGAGLSNGISGFAAAVALWVAAVIAIRRDLHAKQGRHLIQNN